MSNDSCNTPALSQDHKREMRQLWFVAESYWSRARELLDDDLDDERLDTSVSTIARWFNEGIPAEEWQRRITLSVAHISSCCVRLSTIDERWGRTGEKEKVSRLTDQRMRDHMTESDVKQLRCIHELLRHNVGHKEGDDKGVKRQEFLERLTIRRMVALVECVRSEFECKLRKTKVI